MMRALVLTCLALALGPHPLSAQGLALGVKGGANLATQHISGDSAAPSLDTRIGLVGGVFVTLPLGSWLDLQAEGLYSMKGARLTVSGIESTLQVDYFEVPVLGRVRFGGGHRRYYVGAGPSTAFRLRARTRTTFSSSTEEIDISDQVERLDFGIAAGGGVEFGSLVIDGRYTHGLRDIDKDKTDASKTFNRAIALTAGFRF